MTQLVIQNIKAFIADPTTHKHQAAIWQILVNIDQEFVPPLSSRGSTTAMALDASSVDSKNRLEDYFGNILHQVVILSQFQDQMIGFLTFKQNYKIRNMKDIPKQKDGKG